MQTRKALASFSDTGERPFGSDLGQTFQQQAQANTQRIEEQKRARIEDFVSTPHLSVARKKLAEVLSDQLSNNDAPCLMKFDAYQRVKQIQALHSRSASSIAHADNGLRRLGHQLKLAWERDPTGAFTVGNLERLRQHYAAQYPKSQAAEIIGQDLPKHGFGTVDLQPLVRAAQEINTQEEYDNFIQAAGLTGNSVGEIRSRALLKELVNKKLGQGMGERSARQRRAQMAPQQLYDELDDVSIGLSHKVQDFLEATEAGQGDDSMAEQLSGAIADEDIRLSNEFEDLYNNMTGQQVFACRGARMRPFSIETAKRENQSMLDAVKRGEYSLDAVDGGRKIEAVSPPGWEEGVEKLKEHEDEIETPEALAWWMKEKGYEEPGTAKESLLKLSAVQRKRFARIMRTKRQASRTAKQRRTADYQLFIGKPQAPADGEWVDLEGLGVQDLQEEAKRIVAPDEEWIVSDYDLGGYQVSGEPSFEEAVAITELFTEAQDEDAAKAALELTSDNVEDAKRALEDAYQGTYDSEEDWAYEWIDSVGWDGVGEQNMQNYFDYASYARDAFMGDLTGIDVGGKLHVFFANY